MPPSSSSPSSKLRSSMRSAARAFSSPKLSPKKSLRHSRFSSAADGFPDRSTPTLASPVSSSVPIAPKSKPSSSFSFPNLGRFVHRERRCSDLSSTNHHQFDASHSSSSPSTSASKSFFTSVSHHRQSSTSNTRRSLLSPTRSVSLDFISRRRKSSSTSARQDTPSFPSRSCADFQTNDITPAPPDNEPTISSIHYSEERHSRDYADLNFDTESLESRRTSAHHSMVPDSSTLTPPSNIPVATPQHPPSSPRDNVSPMTVPRTSLPSAPTDSLRPRAPSQGHTLPDSSDMSSSSLEINRYSTKSAPSVPTSTTNRLLRSLRTSQRSGRLSIGHRTRSRDVRSSSFGEIPRSMWTSGSLFSQRHSTDDGTWSHSHGQVLDHDSNYGFRKKSHSHSYSDFEITEEDDIVEIGNRLPDRTDRIGEEDVFGRRRGDIALSGDSSSDGDYRPVLACYDDMEDSSYRPQSGSSVSKGDANDGISSPVDCSSEGELPDHGDTAIFQNSDVEREVKPGEVSEEEETLRNIAKAIDSSKGRLGKSANMSKAFRAVIRSGEGFVRKSDLIQATLNNNDSKDASMIILLEPDSYDSFSPSPQEGDRSVSTSEESASADAGSSRNSGFRPSGSIGFSTSMTAKQCAATLETLLREMACKVTRNGDDVEAGRCTIRLRVTRVIPNVSVRHDDGSKVKRRGKMDRKMRVVVTIREEDHIRTSVSFAKLGGLYSSRESHEPLCSEIRDRFQREWPAVVEALYIRLPSTMNVMTSNNSA